MIVSFQVVELKEGVIDMGNGIKLFCIPFSGGSAEVYRKWSKSLHSDIQLFPVELPGRGKRIFEPLLDDIDTIVKDITATIAGNVASNDDYAIYGHSLGSLLAFETYYKLIENGVHKPQHIFFSGRNAPQNKHSRTSIHRLPDEQFLHAVMNYGGNTHEIIENQELLDLFLPILRADFKISETYCHQEKTDKIACDITIINGRNDHSASMYDMSEWSYYAGRAATFHTVDGGHFFITENYEPVVDIIKQTLTISDEILERQ
ncbi:thioesterase [Paenibacillus alvei]|uniref:Thioesterase n=2 Tax=Paenibacillus alvei TaxID=44250 RepID=A0AAP7A205_PAEAL|nr:thioesterase [Paenibacillus alvei]